MFPKSYFTASYFTPRYFQPIVVVVGIVSLSADLQGSGTIVGALSFVAALRKTGEVYDGSETKFDFIGDDNDILEMVTIILLMVE